VPRILVEIQQVEGGHRYTSQFGSIPPSSKNRGTSRFATPAGRCSPGRTHDTTTPTLHPDLPFSFVRRAADYSRAWTGVHPVTGEKIFGCGNHSPAWISVGRRSCFGLTTPTAFRPGLIQTDPFFMSNAGYGCSCTPPLQSRAISGIRSAGQLVMLGDDEAICSCSWVRPRNSR